MARTKTLLGVLLVTVLLAILPRAASAGDEELDFEPDAIEKSGPPSKTLERALKLYDKGDYYSASIELFKVVKGESSDSDANKERAQFFLAKTLYQMRFYAAAMAYFDAIVEKGGAHRYHGITLKWLAALSKVLPDSSGILEKIGKYGRDDLEDQSLAKVKDELYYLLGRHFYRAGDTAQAIELFQTVSDSSEWYLPAKFMEAVTYVRDVKGSPAVEALKEILVISSEENLRKKYPAKVVREYTELANLTMGRIFYSTKQFDTSIKYFEKLPPESFHWLDSLFESSWAYYMRKTFSKGLGNVHTLNAPYFEDEYFPESVKLKAVMYFDYCRYDRAQEAILEFDQTYAPVIDEIAKMVQKDADDNAQFYGFAQKLREGRSGVGKKEAEVMAASALQDKTLLKGFAYVEELDRELKQHEESDKAWKTTAVAGEVLQELTVQKSLAEAEAGRLARERLQRLLDELNAHRRDMRKVKIEILNAMAGKKSAELLGQQAKGLKKEEAIVVDDEHVSWPFNGEYWKDELGFYRVRMVNECAERR